jgi:hypothetical protein
MQKLFHSNLSSPFRLMGFIPVFGIASAMAFILILVIQPGGITYRYKVKKITIPVATVKPALSLNSSFAGKLLGVMLEIKILKPNQTMTFNTLFLQNGLYKGSFQVIFCILFSQKKNFMKGTKTALCRNPQKGWSQQFPYSQSE